MKTIFVLVFWLRALSPDHPDTTQFEIAQTELGGIAPSASVCATLPMADVLKPIKDAVANIANGLVPKVVCGIAAPEPGSSDKQAPAEKTPESSQTDPGHGVWGNGPSGAI